MRTALPEPTDVPAAARAFFETGAVVGVTGHRLNRLTPAHEAQLAAISGAVFADAASDTQLLSCLAEGVDTVLAETWPERRVLKGLLPVAVPAWRMAIARAMDPTRFDRLSTRAELGFLAPSGPIDFAALARGLVDRSDRIFAVWDGAHGKPGGTGSVVRAALGQGKPVLHLEFHDTGFVWPNTPVLMP